MVLKAIINPNASRFNNTQNFWVKKFASLHQTFLTLFQTYMLPKYVRMENPSQYRPITCVPTLDGILALCFTNRIYEHIDDHNDLAEEQGGC